MTLVTPVIQSAGPSGPCRPFLTHHRDHERYSNQRHGVLRSFYYILLLGSPRGRARAADRIERLSGRFCDHKSQVWVWQRPTNRLQLVSLRRDRGAPGAS